MITIDWQPMPPHKANATDASTASSQEPRYYPRINNSRTVKADELFKLASQEAGNIFSHGELQAAFCHVINALATQLQSGNNVEIPDLGTFRLQIEADKDMHLHDLNSTHHVHVRGTSFVPSRSFMSQIGEVPFKWQPSGLPSVHLTDSQILERLSQWFDSHDTIKRKELSQLTNLKQTATHSLILRLISEGTLIRSGRGKNTTYTLSRRNTAT